MARPASKFSPAAVADVFNAPYASLEAYLRAARRGDGELLSAPAPGGVMELHALVDAMQLQLRLLYQHPFDTQRVVYDQVQPQDTRNLSDRSVAYLAVTRSGHMLCFEAVGLARTLAPPPVVPPAVAAAPQLLPAPPPRRRGDGFYLRDIDGERVEFTMEQFERGDYVHVNGFGFLKATYNADDHSVVVYNYDMNTDSSALRCVQRLVTLEPDWRMSPGARAAPPAEQEAAAAGEEVDAGDDDMDVAALPSEYSTAAAWTRFMNGHSQEECAVLLRRTVARLADDFYYRDAQLDLYERPPGADGDEDALDSLARAVGAVKKRAKEVSMSMLREFVLYIVGGEGTGKSYTCSQLGMLLMLSDTQLAAAMPDAAAAVAANAPRWSTAVHRRAPPGPEHDALFAPPVANDEEELVRQRIEAGFSPPEGMENEPPPFDKSALMPSGSGLAVTSVPNYLHMVTPDSADGELGCRVLLHLLSLREAELILDNARRVLARFAESNEAAEAADESVTVEQQLNATPRYWCERALAIVGDPGGDSDTRPPQARLAALVAARGEGVLCVPARMRAVLDAAGDAVWEFRLHGRTREELRTAVRDILLRETQGPWSCRGLVRETHTYLLASESLTLCELPGFGNTGLDHYRQHVLRETLRRPFSALLHCTPALTNCNRGIGSDSTFGLTASGVVNRFVNELGARKRSFDVITLVPLDQLVTKKAPRYTPVSDPAKFASLQSFLAQEQVQNPLYNIKHGRFFESNVREVAENVGAALRADKKAELDSTVERAVAKHLRVMAVDVSGSLLNTAELQRTGAQYTMGALRDELLRLKREHEQRLRCDAMTDLMSDCMVPLFELLAGQLGAVENEALHDPQLAGRVNSAVKTLKQQLDGVWNELRDARPATDDEARLVDDAVDGSWQRALPVLVAARRRVTRQGVLERLNQVQDYGAGQRGLREDLLSAAPQETPMLPALLKEFQDDLQPFRFQLKQLVEGVLKARSDAVLAAVAAWKVGVAHGDATLRKRLDALHAALLPPLNVKMREMSDAVDEMSHAVVTGALETDVPAVLVPHFVELLRVAARGKFSNQVRKQHLADLVVGPHVWPGLQARLVRRARQYVVTLRNLQLRELEAACADAVGLTLHVNDSRNQYALADLDIFASADVAAVQLAQLITAMRGAAPALGLSEADFGDPPSKLDATTARHGEMLMTLQRQLQAAEAAEAAALSGAGGSSLGLAELEPSPLDAPAQPSGPPEWQCPNCRSPEHRVTGKRPLQLPGAEKCYFCRPCADYYHRHKTPRPVGAEARLQRQRARAQDRKRKRNNAPAPSAHAMSTRLNKRTRRTN